MGQAEGPSDGLRPDDVDLEGLLSNLQEIQAAMAKSTQRMALETADAWSRDGLVHVWVNARGAVIQTEIDGDLFPTATSTEVAASVVEAAQAAASKIGEKVKTFQSGLWQQVSALGLPDAHEITQIEQFKQLQPQIPLSAPGSRERRAAADALAADSAEVRVSGESDDQGLTVYDKG